MKFRDVPLLVKYVLFNVPLDLLADSLVYGYITQANLYIADFIRWNVCECEGSKTIKQPTPPEFWTEYAQEMVYASVSAHIASRFLPLYNVISTDVKKFLSYIDINNIIWPTAFSSGSHIADLAEKFEDLHREAHLVEAFIKPYYDILYLNKSKQECLDEINLELQMTVNLLVDIVFLPVHLYNYLYPSNPNDDTELYADNSSLVEEVNYINYE